MIYFSFLIELLNTLTLYGLFVQTKTPGSRSATLDFHVPVAHFFIRSLFLGIRVSTWFMSFRGPRWWTLKLVLGGDGPLQPGAGDCPDFLAGLNPLVPNTFFADEPPFILTQRFSWFSVKILALRVGLAFLTGVLALNLSTETDLSFPPLCATTLWPMLTLVTSLLGAGRTLLFWGFCFALENSPTSLGVGRRGLGSREGMGTSLPRLDGSKIRFPCKCCLLILHKSAERLHPSIRSFIALHLQLSELLALAIGCTITV